ncbi:MAG: hypothetical protein KIT31_13550 [Deltaproteobacteria bacterium]|nr:hypothetical protein [Deltaproteobacteria bacterium]
MRVVLVASLLLVACRPPGYGKGGDDDDVAVDAPKATAGDAPPATTCDHTFRLEGESSAASVWLTGSFIAWGGDPANGAVPLALGGDGAWTVTHTFDSGAYLYKFIVDGTSWIADPANPDGVDDGFGGRNSLYTCIP